MIAQYSGPDRKLEYLFQHANEVSLSPILTTGTPLATLTIDGQQYTLYCTTGGGGGGSTVSYNSLITSGTALGELTIDGIKYIIYSKDSSKVAYTPIQTSGTQIGTLTIDGTPYVLYAPTSGGGGSSYAETDLWTGSGDMYTSLSITLSDAYTNYDALRFEYGSVRADAQNVPVHYEKTVNKETLTTIDRFSISDFYLWNNVGVNVSGQFVDSTHLTTYLEAYSWFTSCTLTKIVGIKYGNGGSSTLAGLSDVDVSSPVDGQILRYDGVNQQWVNSDDSSRPQTASGTFTTGANQYDKVEINCGFRPDYIQVLLPFSQSDTVATYDARVSTTTSTWHIPQEGVTYTLTLGEAQGETGISDITDTGFKFRCYAENTRNVACTYIASKAASGNSYSETVLFTGGASSDTTFTLSDTITHYNTINVYYKHNDGIDDYIEVKSYPASFLHSLAGTSVNVLGLCNDIWYYYFHVTDDTHFAYSKSNAGYISDIIGVTS